MRRGLPHLLALILLVGALACSRGQEREPTPAYDPQTPLSVQVAAHLEKNAWIPAARLLVSHGDPSNLATKAMVRDVVARFLTQAFREAGEVDRFAVAEAMIHARDKRLEDDLRSELKRVGKTKMMDQVKWRELWDEASSHRYFDTVQARELATSLEDLPGAGGRYVEPGQQDLVALNYLIATARKDNSATYRMIEPVLKQGSVNQQYILALMLFQRPEELFLPWMLLLAENPDPIIARRAMMAAAHTRSARAVPRLLNYLADHPRGPDSLFAAQVLWLLLRVADDEPAAGEETPDAGSQAGATSASPAGGAPATIETPAGHDAPTAPPAPKP